jgi:hypothetical protein
MILRLDGAKKRSVYQGPGLGVWYALEYPTGRTLAWWEGEEGEREEIGDFPTLEEAYEAIEEHFSRRMDEIVASLEDEVLGPLFAWEAYPEGEEGEGAVHLGEGGPKEEPPWDLYTPDEPPEDWDDDADMDPIL